ncbi:tyrosine-type recombinase/integrase [Nannocystis pusilla]|uniref:tyrosine-type recombinase/integrase n=1 Tax=Nannocystis pusilla TaxID=889268 RepID=UPI003B763BAF
MLLLLHGGLRSSEARALRWGDIDLRKGIMKIQHNYSDGEEATPKGGVAAPVGMSPELSAALRALPRGHKDDHVLTRVVREGPLKGQVSHHTPNTITYRLNKLQEAAGLEKSGPHRLRHACLTILAGRGTDPYRLQAHARHSRLSTTQKYIHLAREQAALEAAAMWVTPCPKAAPKAPKGRERGHVGELGQTAICGTSSDPPATSRKNPATVKRPRFGSPRGFSGGGVLPPLASGCHSRPQKS